MLIEKVQRYVEEKSLFSSGDRILIAYSGGPDSTCLLDILRRMHATTAAVYINHQLRGDESTQEEDFVRKFCADHQIPLYVERLHWSKVPSNLEEASRKKRYRHISKVARAEGFDKVGLAHHREDVAETLLLRLLRGSGARGLAAMKPRRGIYIRPLMGCSKREILDYLDSHQLPFFTDTSNRDFRFQRNRIRLELLPYLEKNFNRAAGNHLFHSALWLHEQQELLTELLEPYMSSVLEEEGDELRIDRKSFLRLSGPLQKVMLQEAFRRLDPSFRTSSSLLDRALETIQKKEVLELPGFLMIESQGDFIRFPSKSGEIGYFEVDVSGAGSYSFQPGNAVLHFSISDQLELPKIPTIAVLDAEKAQFPLLIRNWKKADYFQPLGMPGRKKLSDYWIDCKVPRWARKRIPLVFKDDELVWVAGFHIDHRYRITDQTRKVMRIELQKEHV
jgi:tRNA(Ile)-lysidine synthase